MRRILSLLTLFLAATLSGAEAGRSASATRHAGGRGMKRLAALLPLALQKQLDANLAEQPGLHDFLEENARAEDDETGLDIKLRAHGLAQPGR